MEVVYSRENWEAAKAYLVAEGAAIESEVEAYLKARVETLLQMNPEGDFRIVYKGCGFFSDPVGDTDAPDRFEIDAAEYKQADGTPAKCVDLSFWIRA